MKKGIFGLIACFGLGLASTASAVPVTYEIGSYSAGGYSASWVHGATGCTAPSSLPGGGPLYMCGDPILPVTGIIEGDLIGGFLNVTGGSLLIDGLAYAVGGSGPPDFLASVFGAAFGGFEIEGFGYFIYEPFNMGPGMPNYFDGDEMILWGQNGRGLPVLAGRRRLLSLRPALGHRHLRPAHFGAGAGRSWPVRYRPAGTCCQPSTQDG